MRTKVIIYSRLARLGVLFAALVVAIFDVQMLLQLGRYRMSVVSGLALSIGFLMVLYCYWGRPRFELSKSGLFIRNFLRTTEIAWEAFAGVRVDLGLYVITKEIGTAEMPGHRRSKKILVLSAPAKGGYKAALQARKVRPGVAPKNDPQGGAGLISWVDEQVLPLNANCSEARYIVEAAYNAWQIYEEHDKKRASENIEKTGAEVENLPEESLVKTTFNWLPVVGVAFIALGFVVFSLFD